MFWRNKSKANEVARLESEKLPKPKQILDIVARCIVTELNGEPDLVWGLKNVLRPREGNSIFDFRVFESTNVTRDNVVVKDYYSLDGHPDLILYEGWFDKDSGCVQIKTVRP
ncbi:hypothetical protein ACFLU4_05335 [Chloroflexota bacterium]